jgi:riboflavin kinase
MAIESLEKPIRLSAKVVEGFGRGGKQLGCPTANLCREELGKKLDELPTGIYCGWATVNGQGPYKAVASIGWNPYFKNEHKTVEPHLLHEFKEDFYGAKLKFLICGYLRPEMDFPSLEALIEAIHNDIEQSRQWLDLPAPKVSSSFHSYLDMSGLMYIYIYIYIYV